MKESGAMNPLSDRAVLHAYRAYEGIRKSTTDILYVAKNTGFSVEQISLVKGHIFYNRHSLMSGDFDRFDPSYEMAESWRRLSLKKGNSRGGKCYLSHDIIMIYHELEEIKHIWSGHSSQEAHKLAESKYNYGLASKEYYKSLGLW